MLRLIKFLFTGDWHLHEWEIINQNAVSQSGEIYGRMYTLQCKRCGNIKRTQMDAN